MVTPQGNALWQLIIQSDAISKGVLIVLLLMSIACWSIFFYKLWQLYAHISQLRKAHQQLAGVTTMPELAHLAHSFNATPAGSLLQEVLTTSKHIVEHAKARGKTTITQEERISIADNAYEAIDILVDAEQSHLTLFSASVAISPLLGLFGTIWGLVHAFVRIAQLQTADIATVAPGIAEALITTLAGLLVAIPAVGMLSVLNAQLKRFETTLELFAQRTVGLVTRLLV